MPEPLDVYRRVIAHFTELVDSIPAEQWSASTPCEGWSVRDLVEHVIVRDRRLAASVGGPPAGDSPSEHADLAALWHERVAWWSAGLADPQRRDARWDTRMGEMTFAQATATFMTGELTIHGWDLARGLGADDTQDPEAVHSTLAMMRQHADSLRQPGALGPAVDAPDGSDEQAQLMAFTGRHV